MHPNSAEVDVRVVFSGDGYPADAAVAISLYDQRPGKSGKFYDVAQIRADACGKFNYLWSIPGALAADRHASVGVSASALAQPSGADPACCKAATTLNIIAPPAAGKIFSPADRASIPQSIKVTGTVRNLAAGHEPWLFVGFPNGGRYFPGNDENCQGTKAHAVQPDASGAFSQCDVEFGGISDRAGDIYDLVLMDVGPDGVRQLKEYFDAGSTGGFDREILRQQGTFLHAITVQRVGLVNRV